MQEGQLAEVECESPNLVSIDRSRLPEEVCESGCKISRRKNIGNEAFLPCETKMEVGTMVNVRLKMYGHAFRDPE